MTDLLSRVGEVDACRAPKVASRATSGTIPSVLAVWRQVTSVTVRCLRRVAPVHTERVEYFAPLLALAVVIVLGVVSRWVFAPNIRSSRKDYGLLVPVATLTVKSEAEHARDRLTAVGIRATLGPSHQMAFVDARGFATVRPPGHHVLVFPQDCDRAANVLSGG
jgi:hypothetical protein